MSNLSCSDRGQYVCVAEDGDHEARETTTLLITRDPEAPTLEIPDKLVEFRTSANPKCVASSLGYNPGMHFAWMLKQPDGREEKLEPSRYNNSTSPLDCDSTGNSVLDAQNYVTWNGSDLCCQLIDTTNSSSVVKETCEKLVVLPAVVIVSDPVADIDEPYSLRCLARNVSGDAQVTIHHKDQLLASFNTSARSGDVNASDISVGGRLDGDTLIVTLNFTKITCADGGSYKCSVNDSGVDTNATVTLTIRRPPTEPVLEVPDAAEGVTYEDPKCKVTSLGYNPVMTLTWVLKKPDGGEETKDTYDSNSDEVTINDDTCDSSIAQTMLDANRYSGWNNSELCCQVTDPHTSTVVKEKCQLMLLVPGDYCSGNVKNLVHPYDPCHKWVQCNGETEYVNSCKREDECYNIEKDWCAKYP